MEQYPRICIEKPELVVQFAPIPTDSVSKTVEMVLDFNQFQEVIGIEIISLFHIAGKKCLDWIRETVATTGDGVKYSYDSDCDAFYLVLTKDRSFDQGVIEGEAILDKEDRILAFRVKLSN